MDLAIPPIVFLVITAAVALAFGPAAAARPVVVYYLLVPYLVFTGVAIWRAYRDGTLLDLFRWRSGDIARGAGLAVALVACVYLGKQIVAPAHSPADLWVMRLYLQLGEVPVDRTGNALLSLAVVATAAAEEITWRGLVQQILEERLGVRRGWLLTAALYALAHAPTLWLLAMPGVGKNPTLVAAALFCGLVWGFLAGRMQRLPPAIVSHAFFTYALAMQLRLWP
jgi:membrane protease YdiL (CAAX protease family)